MKKTFIYLTIAIFTSSCNKFLDVVPDNTPKLEQAFAIRTMAERYLATCYSGLPNLTSIGDNIGLLSGDEFWLNSSSNFSSTSYPAWYIALGQQNSNSPLVDFWENGKFYKGITNCNIFLENIMSVPDMDDQEKRTWAAEARVLKAYYHYLVLLHYGPIVIQDQNIPIYSDLTLSMKDRSSVDESFEYIISTINSAMEELMPIENNSIRELGRITQIVAKTIKADILLTAASPLFNGNTDQAALHNQDGTVLFNQIYSNEKWQSAANALKEAIDFAESNGKQIHNYIKPSNLTLKPITERGLALREAFNESENNTEVLWYFTNSIAGSSYQASFFPRGADPNSISNGNILSFMGVTLNVAEKFYSKNGVPIEEDLTFQYANRFNVVTVPNTTDYNTQLQGNYQTASFHLDREPRFYGLLSFDGGRYFNKSMLNDASSLNTNYKNGGNIMSYNVVNYQNTGYMSKKQVNYDVTFGASNAYASRSFPIPRIRLAELYLSYAEALNEAFGPSTTVYTYIDKVRERSGLKGVVSSWNDYSSNPGKPFTKEGLRAIIKQERAIELCFEGKRFYDVRRWKDALNEFNTDIRGWDTSQEVVTPYYRPRVLFSRTFTQRDYFWPISINELRKNSKLVQNLGW